MNEGGTRKFFLKGAARISIIYSIRKGVKLKGEKETQKARPLITAAIMVLALATRQDIMDRFTEKYGAVVRGRAGEKFRASRARQTLRREGLPPVRMTG